MTEFRVLGVGNVLWADEGIGPALLSAIEAEITDPRIDFVDGGTQGLYLLPMVTDSRHLLILDAVDLGYEPGSICCLHDDQILAAFAGRSLSLHQTSVHDLLAAAYLLDWQPDSVTLIGIQIQNADQWGGDLTDTARHALPQAVARAVELIRQWQ